MSSSSITQIPVQLSNQATIRVEAARPLGVGLEEDVASSSRIYSFDRIRDALEGVASEVVTALARVKPQRATVEFGIDIAVESGQLTALLVKGTGTTTLKVTLEWETDPSPK